MRVGIDIDDTIANTNELLIDLGLKFDKEYKDGKGFKNKNSYLFTDMFYWNNEDKDKFLEYFLLNDGFSNIEPKYEAMEVIKKWHDDGIKIYIITYRHVRGNYDIEQITKEWLKKNNFVYDKLITNSGPKGKVCQENKINIMVDDSIDMCNDVKSKGIKVLLFNTNYNQYDKKLKRVYGWQEIDEIVRMMNDERGHF